MPNIDQMGKVNAKYGICGFTSALYALYTHSPGQQHALSFFGGEKQFVLGRIVKFLEQLKTTDTKTLKEIQTFTQSFSGYEGWTLEQYIKGSRELLGGSSWAVVNATVNMKPLGDISVALPPDAVVRFLVGACNLRSAKVLPKVETRHEAIVGVTDGSKRFTKYNGLCHYVYKRGSTYYSWGNRYGSVADANPAFTTCVVISTSG